MSKRWTSMLNEWLCMFKVNQNYGVNAKTCASKRPQTHTHTVIFVCFIIFCSSKRIVSIEFTIAPRCNSNVKNACICRQMTIQPQSKHHLNVCVLWFWYSSYPLHTTHIQRIISNESSRINNWTKWFDSRCTTFYCRVTEAKVSDKCITNEWNECV